MKRCANPSCGKPLSDGYRGNYCDNGGACKQSAYRDRQNAALDQELLARADLAVEAIRAGAEPWRVLALLVWPPATADEARAFLMAAA